MKRSVFCIARSQSQAEDIVDRLRAADVASTDISVLFPDDSGTRDFAHEKHTKAPEGTTAGVASGALTGGVLGWLAGIGALAIPGVGPLIAAGPIVATLTGAAVGGTAGGITGALIGMGIPEYEAKRYESKVQEGNYLISVHTDEGNQAARVKDIFKESGADDIAASGEEAVPHPR